MRVRDVMVRDVFVAHKGDVAHDVMQKFADYRIGGMPIVDDANRAVGYISDGDIMRYLGKHTNNILLSYSSAFGFYYEPAWEFVEADAADTFEMNVMALLSKNVMEIANRKVISVREDDDMVHVAELLAKRNIKKVPVLRGGILVGIVSRGDVVRSVVHKFVAPAAITT